MCFVFNDEERKLCKYADDNTPSFVRDGVIQVTESLKEAPDELFC